MKENRKKVLFTATVDVHIKAFHLPYLKLFKDNGYEVHVATNGDEEIPYCDVKHKVSFERSPIKINNLKAIKQLKKIVDEEKFEIIHCHTPMGSVVTRIAARKARRNGTRVIYTAHGFHFYKGAPFMNWIMFYPIEKILSYITDDLITINNEDYELAKKKFKAKRIHYVPGVGVDPKKFNFEMSEDENSKLRQEIGITKDDFVLIYVAELNKNKNQIMALKVMQELVKENKNIKLLLTGKDSMDGYYQKIAKDYGLEKSVKFLGYRKDVPQLMKISNLAISVSKREGLPINLIEALVCDLPIIATNCRGNRDVVVDNVNGFLVHISNIAEMKEQIMLLVQNYKHYKDKNIHENFKRFYLEKILDKNYDIYFKCNEAKIALIIPNCTDLNRGDQALVYETARIIKETFNSNKIYIMSSGQVSQCKKEGLETFSDILKHPSRFTSNNSNINYNLNLKVKWGVIAVFDFIKSLLILNIITRKIIYIFLSYEEKKSLNLFEKSEVCFVKGGGFIHDYSGGIVGIYTTYYQMYHLILAQKMKKKVYIMPNSYGPFKSSISKKIVNNTLEKCKLVTARESISASAKTNGLNIEIDLFPDLAFFLQENVEFNVKEYLVNKNINIKQNDYIAITVRPYRFSGYDNPQERYYEYKNSFKQFILWLNTKKYIPLFIVHTRAENDHENDEKCIKEICEMIQDKSKYKILKDNELSCRELKSVYGMCKYIVGTRFHSVIFSITQNVPAISITYGGNKGDGIMKDIDGNKFSIKISDLNFEILKNKFIELESSRSESLISIDKYITYTYRRRQELIKKIMG